MNDSLVFDSSIKSQSSIHSENGSDMTLSFENIDMRPDSSFPIEARKLQAMFRLPVTKVYRTVDCKNLMDYLKNVSANMINGDCCTDIGNLTDNDICMEFFRNYVITITEDYLQMLENIGQRQYLNFIKFAMALWNMSDKSESLCSRIASFDIHTHLIRLLGKMNVTQASLKTKQITLFVMSVVGILHNINNKLHYTRARYRDEHLVEYLMPLAALDTSKEIIGLKTSALLLLAFLVNENENSSLNANDDHIVYILDILKSTIEGPNQYSKYYGYHSLEILLSLRHIASPDANKNSLIHNGILQSIAVILKPENEEQYPEEFVAALELLWSLSFSKNCLGLLNEDKYGLRTRVVELVEGNNKDIVLSSRGILWNINAQKSISITDLIRSESQTQNSNGHVMVSYQHSTQEMMIKIKDRLVSAGYKVWMDVDHMRGSFVDAMAEGIQHASVLLLGMCQAFKNSPHCRQEVKYAYTLGIPLVPVMLEQGFTPDGWLGLMCATLIHTEFIDSSKFDTNIVQLQRQLGVKGKVFNRVLSNQDSLDGTYPNISNTQCNLRCCQEGMLTVNEAMSTHQMNGSMVGSSSDLLISVRSDHSSAMNQISNNPCLMSNEVSRDSQSLFRVDSHCPQKINSIEEPMMDCYMCNQNTQDTPIANQGRYNVLNWSTAQCTTWLESHSIDTNSYGSPITDLDGSLLLELAEMRLSAPESFFSALKDELNVTFIDKLRLSRALRRLDELP